MKRSLIPVLLALFVLSPAGGHAEERTSVKGAYLFINDLGRWAVAVMQSDSLSRADRDTLLGRLLLARMDFEDLAGESLGDHAKQTNGAEIAKFTELYAAHIIDKSLDQFADLPIEGFKAVKLLGERDGDVTVMTQIAKTGGDMMRVGWRVRARDDVFKIVDVLFKGVYSMRAHFRNQYEKKLAQGGVAGLIDRLEHQTDGSPTVAMVRQARGQ